MNAARERYLERLGIVRWELRGHGGGPVVADIPAGIEQEHAPAVVATSEQATLEAQVAACTACELHATRTQAVFGTGNRNAEWMVIGEAPGAEEDRSGEPFAGAAGALLDGMLRAAGFAREEVFITNSLKCRPPDDRDPRAEEAAACSGFLQQQIERIAPKLILCLGRIAAQILLGTTESTATLRGRVHHHPATGTPLVVTFHPDYLLRQPGEKRKAWEDLKLAMRATRGDAG